MKQETALEILKQGYCVFITGQPGAGKTFLVNQYTQYLKANNIPVGITASTGIAATHIEGITIHSWSGIGINKKMSGLEMAKLGSREYLRDRINNTEVLIIDEISMLCADQLDTVSTICGIVRGNSEPFGGLQVILVGDFFQLPPISKSGESPARFVSESEVWKNMDLKICYLTEQYRQTDNEYLKVLNAIRDDNITDDIQNILDSKVEEASDGDNYPIELYTHNFNVDKTNKSRLKIIDKPSHFYDMETQGIEMFVNMLKRNCLASERLELKVGAVVMFLKNNFEAGYINGTMGIVEDFIDNHPVVVLNKGKKIIVNKTSWSFEERDPKTGEMVVRATLFQFPIKLAWAVTIFKSQGQSLDMAKIDLRKAFDYGMGYVALSRVTTLDGLNLLGYNNIALKVDPDIREKDKEFLKISDKMEIDNNDMDDFQKKYNMFDFIERNKYHSSNSKSEINPTFLKAKGLPF